MKRLIAFLLSLMLLLLIGFEAVLEEGGKLEYLKEHIVPLDDKDIPKTPSGMKHYLLISMDCWQNNLESPNYNDGMVLVTLDEATGRVIISSFIRDMWVKHTDGHIGRINRAVRTSGPEGLMTVLNRHFGLEIDKYILLDWRHVMEIIDAAGGVELELTESEAKYLRGWSVPENSTEPVLKGAGRYKLNGFSSVIYMRIRKRRSINDHDTQDFGRSFRVRSVLSKLGRNLSKLSFSEAEKFLARVIEILESPYELNYSYPGIQRKTLFNTSPISPGKLRGKTNITASELFEALSLAYSLRNSEIETIRLPFDGMVRPYEYVASAGQIVDFEKVRKRYHEFLFENSYVVTEEDGDE